jgi:hypothetical protein
MAGSVPPESDAEVVREGGCQCGALRYRVRGEPMVAALCHCSMCRRASAAPAVAWAMFAEDHFEMDGSPAVYESSPGRRRSFCGRCGTQLLFTADFLVGMVDVTIGSLDDPAGLPPTLHYWESRRVAWLQITDGLPRYAEFPPGD